MAGFNSGFQRSAREIGNGIRALIFLTVVSIIILYLGKVFAGANIPSPINLNQFYSDLMLAVELVGIISTAAIIKKMPYWGTVYLLGWSAGFLFFWHLGLVNSSDVLVYVVPSILILAIRLLHKATNINKRLEGYPIW